MGRPINKRYFGSGTGDQIKVRAFPTGGAEGDGVIVRQKGSARFIVNVGGVIGLCKLVNKANGSLVAGEMTITVANDAATPNLRVAKISGKKVTLVNGTSASWTFTNNPDPVMDMPEGADLAFTLQPVDRTGIGAGATTFAVTATATAGETPTYQWQVKIGAADFVNVTNTGIYTNATTATLNISVGTTAIGNSYRCVISSPTGGSLTSSVARLIS
jgi:hypothetical protein